MRRTANVAGGVGEFALANQLHSGTKLGSEKLRVRHLTQTIRSVSLLAFLRNHFAAIAGRHYVGILRRGQARHILVHTWAGAVHFLRHSQEHEQNHHAHSSSSNWPPHYELIFQHKNQNLRNKKNKEDVLRLEYHTSTKIFTKEVEFRTQLINSPDVVVVVVVEEEEEDGSRSRARWSS